MMSSTYALPEDGIKPASNILAKVDVKSKAHTTKTPTCVAYKPRAPGKDKLPNKKGTKMNEMKMRDSSQGKVSTKHLIKMYLGPKGCNTAIMGLEIRNTMPESAIQAPIRIKWKALERNVEVRPKGGKETRTTSSI